MHRKFIALIIALAVAATGLSLSAAPARADEDVAKIIAGLTALALIGVAIDRHNDRKDRVRNRNTHTAAPPRAAHRHDDQVTPRPLPGRVARYDLPRRCLRHGPGGQPVLSKRCLQRTYGHTDTLPRACRVRHWNGEKSRKGFSSQCLTDRGYRLTRH